MGWKKREIVTSWNILAFCCWIRKPIKNWFNELIIDIENQIANAEMSICLSSFSSIHAQQLKMFNHSVRKNIFEETNCSMNSFRRKWLNIWNIHIIFLKINYNFRFLVLTFLFVFVFSFFCSIWVKTSWNEFDQQTLFLFSIL